MPICALACNTTQHESTGQTSTYFLIHSRETLVPLDLLMNDPDPDKTVKYCDYVDEMEDCMRRVFEIVREHQG